MDHPAVIFRFISDWKRRQGPMAFREVLVTQVREVLRAWLAGAGKRPAARRAGVDVKTAARYIRAAQAAGLARGGDESQLSDELLGLVVVAAVCPARPAGHGASWEALAPRQAEIAGWVKDGLTLVKMHELLERSGTAVPYRTLARFAAGECGYSSSSRQQVTVPVADGKPGEEVQLDFGYLGMIADGDRRRRLHALVFTAVLSRYCFVYLTFSQTTAAVIAGCEAAWAFFGGMFKVLVPDNLKPVVDKADRLEPRWNREWLEYAQARGLVVDPARVRSPQDKPRVAYCTSSGRFAWS
jgi:transposase